MKGIKIAIILIFVSCYLVNLPAQNRKISGFVSEESSNERIPYATVYIKELSNGAVSDNNGKYTFNLPAIGEYTLSVQALGFEKKELKLYVRKDTVMNFVLKKDILRMEEIVITGTRTPKMLKDVPVPTRLITLQDIQGMDVRNVKDVLETELPGLEFTSHGGTMNINMQGLGGKYILFLIDGERVSGETRDNVDYNRLDVSNIEQIEIVKGAASALYGSNAIGGVVNIITKDASNPWQVNVNSRYGTHAMQQHGGSIGFKRAKFNSLTTGNYKYFRGYTLKDSERGKTVYEDGFVEEDTIKYSTAVKGYTDFSINQKFIYTPVSGLKLTAKGTYYRHEDLGLAKNNKLNDLYQGGNASLRANWEITQKQNIEFAYNFDMYDKFNHYLTEEMAGIKKRTYNNFQHTANILFNQLFSEQNILTVGTEFLSDNLLTYQFVDNKTFQSYNYVVFAQHDILLWKKFNLVYGARLDYNTTYKPHVSPKLSLMYKFRDVSLRASYGGGFRAPSLKELYTDWDHQGMFRLMGNDDLSPEKSQNVSLSAEYTKGIINVSALGYYNYIKDQITTVWSQSEDTAFYTNFGSVQIAGAELNVRMETKFGLSVKASYAYTYTQSLDENEENISNTRPHSATVQIGYRFRKGIYLLNPVIQGKVLSALDMKGYSTSYQQYYTIHYPAYTVWKFILNQQFWNGINLQLGIDNIFDYQAKRQTFNSSLSSGRTFFAGLSIDIDRLCKLKIKD
ncbi:MAG: TonB-dependent receptor [Bacteroidales bacterium]|jgi:outer membrane receptor for ferrienterochelin and colicins|nr:TonB-dependent receptor [Bacteroidales bacterium]